MTHNTSVNLNLQSGIPAVRRESNRSHVRLTAASEILRQLAHTLAHCQAESAHVCAGEVPYLIVRGSRVAVASNSVSIEAVNVLADALLPGEVRDALEEVGAVIWQWRNPPSCPGECIDVTVTRGVTCATLALRWRHGPQDDDDTVPASFFEPRLPDRDMEGG